LNAQYVTCSEENWKPLSHAPGLTGGSAAYTAAELVWQLTKRGAPTQLVMTQCAPP
jgi:hypothetical protein